MSLNFLTVRWPLLILKSQEIPEIQKILQWYELPWTETGYRPKVPVFTSVRMPFLNVR